MAPYQVRGCPGGEGEAAPPSYCLSGSSAQPGSPQGCANRRAHRSLLNEQCYQSSMQLLSRESIINEVQNLTSPTSDRYFCDTVHSQKQKSGMLLIVH